MTDGGGVQPTSDTAEKAADMLNAVSGPREVAGVSVSDNGRRQIIDLLKRAGLTEKQATTIVDLGVLPDSLASAKPTTQVAAQFGHMDPAVKAALATLKPKPGVSETSKNGSEDKHVAGKVPDDGAVRVTPTPTAQPDSDDGNGSARSFTVDGQGQPCVPEPGGDSSDALGDLVHALNPFQGWSRSAFRLSSTFVPSVSEETGEVKVTVTTETPHGVTITTEITQSAESDIPTVVTQASDSQTGEALSEPITAKAPNVEAVSAVAFGQLAQGLYEAQAEQTAQDDEPAPAARRGASTEPAEPAPAPSVPTQEPEEVLETSPASDAPSEAVPEESETVDGLTPVPEESEAGDRLPSELLGDLPQHAAA